MGVASRASRSSAYRPIGTPARAAAAATRSVSVGSPAGSASRASCASRFCSTTPSSRGRRAGRLRSQREGDRRPAETRYQVTSHVQEIVRPASAVAWASADEPG